MKFRRKPRSLPPFGASVGAADLRVAQRVGENLARCRDRAGLSVADLAARSRLRAAEIEQLEDDGTSVSVEALLRLSAALGVPSGELLAGISWAPEAGCFEFA